MRAQCIAQVSATLGRRLTPREGDMMVENIRNAMAALRKTTPNWASMTTDQRVAMAAGEVAKNYQIQARKKKASLQKQVIKQAQTIQQMEHLGQDEDIHAYEGIKKILNQTWRRSNGIANEYLTRMLDTLNGIGSRLFGLVENADDIEAFVREAFGENTGNLRAKKAWQAFHEVASQMRDRLEAGGALIGKIENWLPQSHDAFKVRKANRILNKTGMDARDAWCEFMFDKLDRERYVNEAGELLSDADYRLMLQHAYDDIVTGGNPDPTLAEIAKGASSNRGAPRYESRKLHFKDAASYLEYENLFSKGSFTGSLIGHVQQMALDISMVETLGPNARATFDLMKQVADGEAQNAAATEGRARLVRKYSDFGTDAVWRNLCGDANTPAINREGVAGFFQGVRNTEVIGKLGKAFISSFSDIPTYFATTGFNRLPFLQALKFLPLAYGKDWAHYATRMGIMAEGMISDFNRWSGENLTEGWTGKLANLTMKASFLTQFTDATRRAFALNMFSGLARMSKDWNALDAFDRARLSEAGITEADWKIIKAAKTDTHGGIEFMHPQNIRALAESLSDQDLAAMGVTRAEAREVTSKLLGWVISESEMASLNPDLLSRSVTNLGTQKGTLKGELARSFFLFKGFPVAFIRQNVERIGWMTRHDTMTNRLKYMATVTVGSTLFGALSLQVQNMLNGRDAQDMSTPEFWENAMVKGGGLGFMGDFIANVLDDNSRYGAWGTIQFLGPVISDVLEGYDLAASMVDKGLYDKDTKPAARAVRITRSHMPFVNMWYTSLILDRYVMNDIQEALSPGYLQRMQTRTYRSWGQEYWWRPGQQAPSRAPRMATQPDK